MIARNNAVLTFDLETVGQAAHVERVMSERFDPDTFTPKHGAKDPAKIAKQLEEAETEHEASKAARCAELALSPRTGRVVVVGWQINDVGALPITAAHDDDEEDILRDLWDLIRGAAQLVTFNGHSYDLPFLVTRSVLLGVEPTLTAGQIAPFFRRYTHRPHADVRMMLCNWDMRAHGKKSDWAAAFGMPPQAVTGADVWRLYQAGDLATIAKHACDDVAETYQMFERLRPYYLGD